MFCPETDTKMIRSQENFINEGNNIVYNYVDTVNLFIHRDNNTLDTFLLSKT